MSITEVFVSRANNSFLFSISSLALLIANFALLSCNSKITVTTLTGKRSGATPTELGWLEASPHTKAVVTAAWKVANSSVVVNQKIQFYNDASCQTVTGSSIDLKSKDTATYEFAGIDGATYTYKLLAIDSAEAEHESACSSAMAIEIPKEPSDSTAPAVISVSSSLANGAYTQGSVIPISVTMSEIVVVTGTPQLTLETGSTDAVVNYSSGSGTSTLLFNYTVASGHESLDLDYVSTSSLMLNSGSIKDLAGNAAVLILASPNAQQSLAANKAFTIDTAQPTISPIANQATSVSSSTSPIAFTIADSNSTLACNDTYLDISTSNHSLVLASSVVWGGSYPSCTAVISPITGAVGNVSLTITVNDAAGNNSNTVFELAITSTLVLGQSSTMVNLVAQRGFSSPQSLAIAGGKLFLADFGNSRVLVWNSLPASTDTPADFVLGQPNTAISAINTGGLSAASMSGPAGVFSDGTRLFVADSGNNRVLVWNTLPASSGQAADFVLGQPNVTSNTANNGGVSGSSLSNPEGIWSNGTKLYVTDRYNNRVLVWNTMPTTTGQTADIALGQANLTSSGSGVTASTMNLPKSVFSDGTKLFVCDSSNIRVLVWNAIPTASGQAASFALGQVNLTSSTVNSGNSTVTGSTMYLPAQVYTYGGKLFVTDSANHRVLVWNTLPTGSGEAASFAIGQPNLTSNTYNNGGVLATSLAYPHGIISDGTKLYVSDANNSRVLIWSTMPTTSGQAADHVLGQQNFANAEYGGVTASNLQSPTSVFSDGTRLFVADRRNHRVLVWNSLPTSSGQPADFALGQPNLTSKTFNNGGRSGSTMFFPTAVYSDGTKLFVSDSLNYRVLIWNSMPTASGTSADLVLGQSDLTTDTGGGSSATQIGLPVGIAVCGTKLIVGDMYNNRVLIWNTVPTSTRQAANIALGQANLTANTANAGGLSANSLNFPTYVACSGTKLFVTDSGNQRVLVWNTIPTASGQAASFALGQPNMTSNTINNGGISASTMSGPSQVHSDGTRLIVADGNNNRVLVWSAIPTSNGQAATSVYGQTSFVTSTVNTPSLTQSTLQGATGAFSNGVSLFIVDSNNHRVLVTPW
jgi:hypothetical protein